MAVQSTKPAGLTALMQGKILLLSNRTMHSMALVRLRPKNQITLPGKVVTLVGLKEGDFLNVATEEGRIVLTAQEIRNRGPSYTMSDLLGAASGVYRSTEEIDAEIDRGRAA